MFAPKAAAGAWPRYKRIVWTGAFAAVTFVGTIYGAGLKTRREYKEVSLPHTKLNGRLDSY